MARIGHVPCACPGCANPEASVSRTATGTLSVSCHRCEYSGFAKMGTKAHRLTLAAMTPDEDADEGTATAAKPPKASAPPAAAPEPKKRNSVFDLGDL